MPPCPCAEKTRFYVTVNKGPRLEIVRATAEVLIAGVERIRAEWVAEACDGNADRVRPALFSFLFEPECWRQPPAMPAFQGRI